MNLPDEIQPEPQRSRDRTLLVLIVVLFLGSAAIAGALRFSGWRPSGMKNHGELLQPPGDLRNIKPLLADGRAYDWNPVERTWRIVLAPPPGCDAPCVALSHDLDTAWRLFGHNADHVHVLWLGDPPPGAIRNEALRVVQPDPALRAALPRVDGAPGERTGVPVYVVDPNGFVILRYAPGFDPGHLREDMARLLKLR
jgi:hypothetical protein